MPDARTLIERVFDLPGLVSMWDFAEPAGEPRVAKGPGRYSLREGSGPIDRVDEGPLSNHALDLQEGRYLYIPRCECPTLNIHGPQASVTVAAWIKRRSKEHAGRCEAIAGMWNETGCARQYCLFVNLRIHQSGDQVCGHVSGIGGPTPGHRYCMDAAIGSTPVPFDVWQFIAFTYDGRHARSYLNGRLDERPQLNPYAYDLGIHDGGKTGADFTVGAVDRSGEMGNYFVGLLGGLAVFNRALGSGEIEAISPAAG
jgi:hypothetical protein